MLDEQVDLTFLLEKLYKTGKIDKKYIWALRHYIEKLNKENQCLKGILQKKYEESYNNAKIVKIDTYRSRCEKAIEYMKKVINENEEWNMYRENKLLNILEGEK